MKLPVTVKATFPHFQNYSKNLQNKKKRLITAGVTHFVAAADIYNDFDTNVLRVKYKMLQFHLIIY